MYMCLQAQHPVPAPGPPPWCDCWKLSMPHPQSIQWPHLACLYAWVPVPREEHIGRWWSADGILGCAPPGYLVSCHGDQSEAKGYAGTSRQDDGCRHTLPESAWAFGVLRKPAPPFEVEGLPIIVFFSLYIIYSFGYDIEIYYIYTHISISYPELYMI